MNKTKSKLYFFFSLIGTLLLSACGVRNHHGFVGEDARFANYTFLGTDGDGSAGLAYYADETNPNQIAVSIGTCTATDIVVTTYDNKPVTSVFPSGFQNCDTIQTITLPDSVTTFGTDAFAGSSLQSITIPKNLEVIASGSFRNCKSLDTVRFKKDNQLNTINDYAFANCYTLATFPFHEIENLRTIGKEAFLYCIELTSIVFPDHFTTLESYAFQDCKSLTTIYFPASTTYVAANAFRGVGHSARIYFSQSEPGSESSSSSGSASSSITPMSLAEDFNFSYGNYYIPVAYGVGQMKFDDDYPYFQFITPDTGDYPLYECTTGGSESNWKSTATIEYTEHIAKNEVLIMNYTGVGIANITIPSTILNGAFKVVGIMSEVFKARADIKKVTFHENLRFIDFGAFRDCTKLTDIELSDAVDLKYIQSRAFFNTIPSSGGDNASLYSIHIPSNVENIAADAFRSCDGLFRLYFDGATNEYEEA
ncbi:MAG: leucine-rich repeat protein, partial [Bacteroidales bacterium]|nr:leucine-rich repeat protein [Bacteroidales bacterium]